MSGALFRQTVTVFMDRHLTPAAASARLANAARDGLRELIQSGRSPYMYTRYVDGRVGVPEERVTPEGVIVYKFNVLPAVIGFALGYLKERSPVGNFKSNRIYGPYKKSWFVAVNGKLIREADFRPQFVPPDAEIFIGNVVPYHRRVDVQLDGTVPLRFSVPPNLIADCSKAVQRRFGGALDAYRVYTVLFPGQYILKTGPRRGRPVHSPALRIAPRGKD